MTAYLTAADVAKRIQQLASREELIKTAAYKCGIKIGYFYDLIEGRRKPGDKTLAKLGLRRVTVYEEVTQ